MFIRLILITEDVGGQDLKTLMKTRTFTLQQLLKIAADIVRILGKIDTASLIMKLLAKNPEDRYQSTRGIEADLTECVFSTCSAKNIHLDN